MTVQISSLDYGLKSTEKVFNKAGYVPFLSTLSGAFRLIGGLIEVITGVVFSIFNAIAMAAARDPKNKDFYKKNVYLGMMYSGHGVANIVRSFVEIFPFVNLVTIKYDKVFRICYPYEVDA
jgi:hypothetical protein